MQISDLQSKFVFYIYLTLWTQNCLKYLFYFSQGKCIHFTCSMPLKQACIYFHCEQKIFFEIYVIIQIRELKNYRSEISNISLFQTPLHRRILPFVLMNSQARLYLL